MIYLVIGILISCIMPIIFRFTEPKGYDGDNVTWVNYIVCSVVSLVRALSDGAFEAVPAMTELDMATLVSEKSLAATGFWAILLGVFSGFLYLSSLVAARRSYLRNGVGITVMFEKCSFLIALVLGVILWSNIPTLIQIVGIVLATIAIGISVTGRSESRLASVGLLLVCFVEVGFIQLFSNAFMEYAVDNRYQGLFMLGIFGTAAISCGFFVKHRNKKRGTPVKIAFKEMLAGAAVGLVNVSNTTLQLKALETLSPAIVFPSLAAGSLVISTVASRILFKEKMSGRQLISAVITMVSLVLVNM